jgi:hypothetical protein
LKKKQNFFDKRILITAGENPRGDTVFRDIITEPPSSEAEFILLWKLYIVSLAAREMRNYDIRGRDINAVYTILEQENLLEKEKKARSTNRQKNVAIY